MKGEKFKVNIEGLGEKEASLVTIIKSEENNIEYIYYSIDEEDGSASIYASKFVTVDGKEIIDNLDDEKERQYAYDLFSKTYKSLKEENKN